MKKLIIGILILAMVLSVTLGRGEVAPTYMRGDARITNNDVTVDQYASASTVVGNSYASNTAVVDITTVTPTYYRRAPSYGSTLASTYCGGHHYSPPIDGGRYGFCCLPNVPKPYGPINLPNIITIIQIAIAGSVFGDASASNYAYVYMNP